MPPSETGPRRVPVSTYRIQLHRDFGFRAAADLVGYLAQLGVTDLYSSPVMMARAGSRHGYDVTNHNVLNPELGTAADHDALSESLGRHGLGYVLDFVPNHMGIDPRLNPWWRDVLENGPCSAAGRFFDIDWRTPQPQLTGKLLLPILGDQYGEVLERGEIQLAYDAGTLLVRYFEHQLPVNPRMIPKVLRYGLDALQAELPEDDPGVRELLSILTALQNLPNYLEADPARIAERRREKEVARDRLHRLVETAPRIRNHIETAVRVFNGVPGRPASFDLLHDLLEGQAYRLSYWRTAFHEINYRRFFDINDLAGLRVEDDAVFDATHDLMSKLLADHRITGVRIDHPDGLFDPGRYFARVQELATARWSPEAAGDARPLYLLAEKILSADEDLPAGWPVHGTTGYNFLNDLNGLFVNPDAARPLRRFYVRISGSAVPIEEVIYESKRLIMSTALASELNVLAHELNRISESDRKSRDFTLNSLHDVLREVVACFPVYRTYVSRDGWTEPDRQIIDLAIRRARLRNPVMEPSIFQFVRDVLLPARPAGAEADHEGARAPKTRYPPVDEQDYERRLRFSMKFQQYTGPVQAKGLEDTSFYRYNLLLSLNEVGGDPGRFGRSDADYHRQARHRLERWPYEMLATATHDTKLGEDVRARINVLSELESEWRDLAARWLRMNQANRTLVDGRPAPDRNDELRFYQALLGVWPASPEGGEVPALSHQLVERLQAYMIKAIKEAKLHTSWINDNEAYDSAVTGYVANVLRGPTAARFLPSFLPFQRRVARAGVVNSLAQVVVKALSPGVPDFYQGTELWDLNLVDPDNRRPVDFDRRRAALNGLEPLLSAAATETGHRSAVEDLLAEWPDGRIKLLVTSACLRRRRADPELFLEGAYEALSVEHEVAGRTLAFARLRGDAAVIALVPRLTARLVTPDHPFPVGGEIWKTSRVLLPPPLAGRTYHNLFTREVLSPAVHRDESWLFVGEVLSRLPVAVLVAEPG